MYLNTNLLIQNGGKQIDSLFTLSKTFLGLYCLKRSEDCARKINSLFLPNIFSLPSPAYNIKMHYIGNALQLDSLRLEKVPFFEILNQITYQKHIQWTGILN